MIEVDPVLLVVPAIILFCMLFAIASERLAWNGGIAPSGKPWQHFDTDSQCGRGYTDGEGNYIWISWPWIDAAREGK